MRGLPSCPDENELAAFAEGRLAEEARGRVLFHVADCGGCLDQVAFLKSTGNLEARVPDRLLEQARQLPRKERGRYPFRFAAAAAAVLVVSVLTPWFWSHRDGDAGNREVRGRASAVDLEVLAPAEGEVTSRADLAFRWIALEGAVAYTATVLTDGGDPLFEQRTEGTEIDLPSEVELSPGVSYFFWVRAHLRDGRTIRSLAVEFSVT
ncbi:MAG: hypothetical protein ACRD1Z_06910, partial [Vicinamibacteria bacterium]